MSVCIYKNIYGGFWLLVKGSHGVPSIEIWQAKLGNFVRICALSAFLGFYLTSDLCALVVRPTVLLPNDEAASFWFMSLKSPLKNVQLTLYMMR